jgi:hypothetical protein
MPLPQRNANNWKSLGAIARRLLPLPARTSPLECGPRTAGLPDEYQGGPAEPDPAQSKTE